ncbi:MAG: outer membrane beta-barrel protein [Bacteroidota bacterium]
MKKLLFGTVFTIAAISASAQLKAGAGLNVGVPVQNLSGSSIAVGADLMLHYNLSKAVAVTGDVGYTALFAKNGGKTTSIIPLRAGLRYYPSSQFFIGGKIGAGFLSGNGSITTTAYSIGAGFKMDDNLEIGASYDAYNKEGVIGLLNFRLGYFF